MRKTIQLATLLIFVHLIIGSIFAQSTCDPVTPSFNVNLSSSPSASYFSPLIQRQGHCCGASNPDICVEFVITLHPDAIAVNFDIYDGAVPTGSMFYQINCGTPIPVGDPICLNGEDSPFTITFCKPGNNQTAFSITSYSAPTFGPDMFSNEGCSDLLYASYYDESSITWTSISPGATGTYNSYLSCISGCDSTMFTPAAGLPSQIDYLVCGNDINQCFPDTICGIISVFPVDAPQISFSVDTAFVCSPDDSLYTGPTYGNSQPALFTWSNGNMTDSTFLSSGWNYLTLSDTAGCYTKIDSIFIGEQPVLASASITSTSGIICDPGVVDLSATMSNAQNPLWSGGSGSFSPTNDTITQYTPSAGDISNGSNYVYFTGHTLNQCPDAVDSLLLIYGIITETITSTVTDVSCYGGSDGTATVYMAPGIHSPYTYSFDGGAAGADTVFTGLAAGTYDVTILNSLGCDTTVQVTIAQPDTLTPVLVSQTNVSCNGLSDGDAEISVSGGTAPYTYSWSNGDNTATISGLAAGSYTCTITDAQGCQVQITVTITEPPVLTVTLVSQTNVSCNGLSDGAATITASGGTAPYTYSWSNGATTASLSNVPAGSYTCTVTDAHSCQVQITVTIIEPPVLTVVLVSQTNVSCNGLADGTAEVSASGGTSPYTYSWSNGAGTAAITGLAAGSYTCTVTDGNGCQTQITVTITEPPVLTTTLVSQTNVSCNGLSNGEAEISAAGGTAPYTYLWSNGATTAAITNLAAGSYTCTVTDAQGCQAQITVTITEPPVLTITISSQTNVSCFNGSDGAATIVANGGTAPYSYSWTNGATTTSISNLTAGYYTCTVTDANGCTAQVTVEITQPTVLTSSLVSQTNVSCNGGTDGTATIAATGGTAPYTYAWSNGASTTTISNLAAGSYTCTITDSKGCQTTITVTITQPTALGVTITSQTNVSCNGLSDGAATIAASGGTAPYTYSWTNGATTASISNVSAGAYTCTVTDAKGCQIQITVTITEPPVLAVSLVAQTNVTCNGLSNGTASISATGGTSPYSYSWSNGATAADITGLAAGSYTCTVTDANGCQVQITVTITQPTVLTLSLVSQTNVSCNGLSNGAATVAANGGTAPYTYSWTNGATTASISNLAAGNYTCTVTDANGCQAQLTVTITQPTPLTVTLVSQTNVSCNGLSDGAATISANGGTAPYTYAWSNGASGTSISNVTAGSYICTVTDANGCQTQIIVTITEPAVLTVSLVSQTNVTCNGLANGSASISVTGGTSPYTYSWTNGSTTANISNLAAGSYTCTITDAQGCQVQITVTITEPPVLTVTLVDKSNVSCNGLADGTAEVIASGGTVPYSYSWNNGATTAAISNLTAGSYTCTVTDANGCQEQITVVITQPTALTVSLVSQTNVSCNGLADGAASIVASGGTAPYTYSWTNGATTASISNLSAGTYTCTVTDANGCQAQITVTITEPPVLTVSLVSQTNVSCNGLSDGSAEITANGGTSPYTYSWSNGATSTTLSNLAAGSYTCTVTDAQGCEVQITVTITEPPVLTVALVSQTNVSCNGLADGAAEVLASGGTSPYSFSWDNGATTPAITNLAAGSYTCTVTDANGCQVQITVTITEPPVLTLSLVSQTNVTCNGLADGAAEVLASGGTSPYSYSWDNGATTAAINNLVSGAYICTVTDANGCQTTLTVTITEPTPLVVTFVSQTNVSCNGLSDGSAEISVSGGTAPYSYSWSNGDNTAAISGLAAGTYSCTITDAQGCQIQTSVTITEPPLLTVTLVSQTNVSCNVGADASAEVTGTGGTVPYSYSWTNGTTTALNSNLGAGTYTVTVTDANGCQATLDVTITEPTFALDATITVLNDANCFGSNDGSMSVTASGGTAPYSYLWSNGEVTDVISNLAPGTYTCTITDANGCTFSVTGTITQPAAVLTASITSQTNVSCNGGNTGSVSITASGGTPPYTYLWSNGPTTTTNSGLTAGSYTCTITDANGCTYVLTATITEPAFSLSASITSHSDVSCFGGTNGSLTVTAAGGTSPYTYSWNTGATTASISNLPAGTYTCTITDANGCTFTISDVITQPAFALTSSIAYISHVSCNAGNDGAIAISTTGGTPGYIFNWSNGSNNDTITGLTAGNYACTITDTNGCTSNVTATITQPTNALAATITAQSNVACFGAATGSMEVTPTGGTAPYSYSWNSGHVTDSITNLTAGSYTCTITDANGCQFVISGNITQPVTAITASIASQSNVNCFGGSDASVTVSANGGTPGYTYSWNTGATTPGISNLSAGSYACTVTDANGCSVIVNVTITQPNAPLNATITSQNNVNCFGGNDASATTTATEGTAPYSYLWNTGATTATISNLSAGTYTCTVTDANGCTYTLNTTISQPAAPLVLNLISQTNVSCNGLNNGSAQVAATDGTAPYTYAWNNGTQGAVATNLAPGTYVCTVTDANGCQTTLTITITQPTQLAASITSDSTVCEGSALTVNGGASGGTAPYSYSWLHESNNTNTSNIIVNSDTSFTIQVTDSNGCSDSATVNFNLYIIPLVDIGPDTVSLCPGVFTTDVFVIVNDTDNIGYSTLWSNGATTDTVNVGVGTYYVNVTDSYGCATYTDSVVVDQQVILPIVDAGAQIIVCDLQNISLSGSMSNAQNPLWTGGTGVFSPNNNLNTLYTPTSIDLAADSIYLYLSVESVNDCPGNMDSVMIVFGQITESIDVQTTDISCNGANDGTVSVFVTNGEYAPYSYSLDGQTPAGTNAYNNLTPGNHTILITNSLGCDTLLNFVINEPPVLTLTLDNQVNVSCFGFNDGEAYVIAAGGTGSYTYSWSTGGNSTSITNVIAGTYTCTVTDSNGCTASVTVIITEPQPLANSFNFTPIACFGNNTTITSNVGGGTAPYNYVWNNSIIGNPIIVPAGSYNLVITDNNGCTFSDSITISQPSPLNLNVVSQTNVSCFGGNNGTATVAASGGNGPYGYAWSNGLGNNPTATGMAAGTYTCTVTDANGCQQTVNVTIDQPTQISVTTSNPPIQCFGMNTQVTASPSGGTPPYSYLWNGSSTANPISLNAGIHQLQVTDGNGCVFNTSVTITQPTQLTATIANNTPVSCFGGTNGSLTAAGNGGTPGYTYSWSNGLGNNATVSNLPAGTYTCTVTDQNGCSNSVTATVSEPPALSNTFNFNPIQCFGESTTIFTNVSGGTQPYSYIWNGQPSGNALSTTAGTYSLQVIDANGCVLADNVTITQPPQINATLPDGITVCAGTNATLSVSPSGGTPGYTYTWNHDPNNATPSSNVVVSSDTTFSIVILDANNCGLQVYSNFNVYSFDPNDFNLTADQNGYCKGDSATLNYSYTGNAIINTVKWADCQSCTFPRQFQVNNDTTLYAYLLTHCGDTLWDTIHLTTFVNPDIQVALNDSIVCPNEPVLMTVFANSSTLGWQYQWYLENQLYSTSPTPFFNIGTPGFYQIDLNIVTQNGCNIWLEDAAAIQVNPKPYVDFTTDNFIHTQLDPTFDFHNLSIGAISYVWNFGDGSSSTDIEPTHTFTIPESYAVTLIGVNEFGCMDSITRTVRINPEHTIYVPNTFTPDGDQFNDYFFAKHDGLSDKEFEMTIFDRWGHIIFETTDPNGRWDGTHMGSDKLAPQGVYTWVIKYRDLGNKTHRLVGHVTLLK